MSNIDDKLNEVLNIAEDVLDKKEVTTGANGTQDYIIKKGINSGKIADKGQ